MGMGIELFGPGHHEALRRAGRAAAATLAYVAGRLAAGVSTGDIDRWVRADTERRGGLSASLKGLFGRVDLDEATRAILREASPIRHVRAGLPPFLLVHGSADMSVPYEQSPRFQKALREAGVPCDLVTIPDGTHGTARWDGLSPGWRDEVVAWIARTLGGPGER